MMKTTISEIKIEEPCFENWETMENRGERKFCLACNKHVTDFTGYSNVEIIETLTNASSQICGRLSQIQLNQLNYYLLATPKNKSWLKYIGVLAIGASIFVQEGSASAPKYPAELSSYKKTDNGKPINSGKIYGYVFDAAKKPLQGIRVVLNDSKYFALTDKNGRYQIIFDKKTKIKDAVLSVESIRFSASMKVNLSNEKQTDLILKVMEPMIVGRIIVAKKGTKFL